MTVDDVVGQLSLAYVPGDWQTSQPSRITNQNVLEWSEATGLPRSALYDAIALKLATGFQRNAFDFGFCDHVVNELHAVISIQNEARPALFWSVFLAFDAGEYYHNNDRSIDPVEAFTRPLIATIVHGRPQD
jgi:hypothetical protein